MKKRSTIFSDFGQMAQGAASLLDEMRIDVKNMINAREQRKQNEANLVTYEDFQALTTRLENVISRIELLEAHVKNVKELKQTGSKASKKISKKNKF